jgi:hypothetical protein
MTSRVAARLARLEHNAGMGSRRIVVVERKSRRLATRGSRGSARISLRLVKLFPHSTPDIFLGHAALASRLAANCPRLAAPIRLKRRRTFPRIPDFCLPGNDFAFDQRGPRQKAPIIQRRCGARPITQQKSARLVTGRVRFRGGPFQFRYNNRENADIFGTAIKGC